MLILKDRMSFYLPLCCLNILYFENHALFILLFYNLDSKIGHLFQQSSILIPPINEAKGNRPTTLAANKQHFCKTTNFLTHHYVLHNYYQFARNKTFQTNIIGNAFSTK